MCAECDRFGRPSNAYCRSVSDTRKIQEAIEREQARQQERARKALEDSGTTE